MRSHFIGGVLLLSVCPLAVAADDAKKTEAERQLAALQYPDSKRHGENNLGTIAQVSFYTADELEKVDDWYRKTLKISKAFIGGVADVPWPSGVKATEAKGQQQWAVFRDDLRPTGKDNPKITVREGTTRSYVVRNPEQTAIVTINRAKDDKETMISVTVMPVFKK